ncbi:MAG: ACT domain-containing protein, partial [Planktomarina sp.]|nr:ACT domain-containing protein [Planktomarina sp.]
LLDKPGALAKIASVMGEAGVSVDRMRQYGHDAGNAPVLIVTHKTTRTAIDQVLVDFNQTQVVDGTPVVLRIESA